MRHLTPIEILSIVEKSPLATAERVHVESCAECRAEAAQLTAVLDAVRQVEVPEPSPMFWDRLSDRVRESVAAEPAVRSRAPQWLPGQVLVPFAGLALLTLALVSTVAPRGDAGNEDVSHIALDGASDSAWALLSELVASLDVETAQRAGIGASPGAADEAVLQMSAAEQEELVRLLRQELEQPGG